MSASATQLIINTIINAPSLATSAFVYATDVFWADMGDLRVNSKYPLMSGGPMPIVAIVSLYVYYVRVLGPRMMKSRQPYDLKWPIRLYNVLMCLANAYTFYRVAVLTRMGIDYFGCKQVGKTRVENEMVQLGFIYFATKIIELLDTIFFILRKKNNQASNLHVFHHGFIAICVWVYFKIAPGGSSVLFPFLNSGVHVVMYGYYFLATYPSLQRHLWWKRYLTLVQIIQFVLSMIHFSFQGLSSCQYPPALAIIGFLFNFVFFVLFIDFYRVAYTRQQKQQHKQSIAAVDTSIVDNNKQQAKHKQQVTAAAAIKATEINNNSINNSSSKVVIRSRRTTATAIRST